MHYTNIQYIKNNVHLKQKSIFIFLNKKTYSQPQQANYIDFEINV